MRTLPRLLALPALALGLALAMPLTSLAAGDVALQSSVTANDLPKSKRTKAGLYITAAETGAVMSRRDDVVIVDVRTPEETMLVGHTTAAMANVPIKLIDPDHELNAKKGSYSSISNPNFVTAMQDLIGQANPAAVVIMCRSGSRSAMAVNQLMAAGVDLPLYSMVDGFEGDKNEDGRRLVNGWKNADLDWTYKVSEGFLRGVE